MNEAVARARALADEVIWPAGPSIAAAGRVARRLLDALAAGDLSTAFVWLQHLGVVSTVARASYPGLPDLCAGRVRAGVALQAATRPGPAAVTVRRDAGGFVVDGDVLWVIVARVPLADWQAGDAAGLRPNGSLALGVVARCARLAAPDLAERLTAALDAVRSRLDAAGPAELPAARAGAAALASRATTALVVATGSAAIEAGSPVARLAREALFLQVFGTRPAIRTALLADLLGRA